MELEIGAGIALVFVVVLGPAYGWLESMWARRKEPRKSNGETVL